MKGLIMHEENMIGPAMSTNFAGTSNYKLKERWLIEKKVKTFRSVRYCDYKISNFRKRSNCDVIKQNESQSQILILSTYTAK